MSWSRLWSEHKGYAADLPAVLYNHNMCNKLLCYQSNNTDCIAENLLEIYIMSLMSLL